MCAPTTRWCCCSSSWGWAARSAPCACGPLPRAGRGLVRRPGILGIRRTAQAPARHRPAGAGLVRLHHRGRRRPLLLRHRPQGRSVGRSGGRSAAARRRHDSRRRAPSGSERADPLGRVRGLPDQHTGTRRKHRAAELRRTDRRLLRHLPVRGFRHAAGRGGQSPRNVTPPADPGRSPTLRPRLGGRRRGRRTPPRPAHAARRRRRSAVAPRRSLRATTTRWCSHA